MQKSTTVLVIIVITLAGTLIAETSYNGSFFSLPKLSTQSANASGSSQVISQESPAANNTLAPLPTYGNSSATFDAQSAVFSQVFRKTANSVVQITSDVDSVNKHIIINGNPLEQHATRLGSGFLFDKEGHIITNNHVVDGASVVDVTFVDGNTYSAKVVGTDTFSDIAVLQISDDFASENATALSLADSSQLQVGQQVIAIGNPFGLSNTMTTGIVSQIGRLLPNEQMAFSIPNVIQTDAAINPGNSGGPLLDIHGNIIGVNTAIRSDTGDFSGIGFAIPSNTVSRIVPHLIKDGSFDHPWLGVTGSSVTRDLSEKLGLERNMKGVVVIEVVSGGPADKAGIVGLQNDGTEPGDIITAIDGHAINSIQDMIFYLEENTAVGNTITMTLQNGGHDRDVQVTLQARPLPTA